MAPVLNRLTIDSTGSTSSTGRGWRWFDLKSIRPRSVHSPADWSSISFEYSLKVPQLVTHKALVEGDKERAIFWATSFEKTCVKPLADAGLLGGVLFQLSPYFKNEGSALDNLKGVLDAVSYQEFDYALEFRHSSARRK